MPPREVEQHFKFGGGVQTKIDAKAVPTANLLVLENGVFDKGSAISKRNGYEDIGQTVDGGAADVTGVVRMATRGSEVLQFTGSRAYSRQTGFSQWSDTGAVYSAVGTDRALVTTGTQQSMGDAATNGGVTAVAWEDSRGGVWWSTVDSTTGRVFRVPTQADVAGISPRCVAVGGNLHVYYVVAAVGQIWVLVIDPSSPADSVTPLLMVQDLDSAHPIYDAAPTQRGTDHPAAIAWFEAGSTNIRVGYVDQSGLLGTILVGTPSVHTFIANRLATSPLAIDFAGGVDTIDQEADFFVLAYVAGTVTGTVAALSGGDLANPIGSDNTFSIATYTATNVQRVALSVITLEVGERIAWTAWEENAAAASNRFVVTASASINFVTSSPGATIRSVGLASRGFIIGTDVFAVFVHDVTFFNTYLTYRISHADADGFVCAGRHLPAQAAGAPPRKHLPSANVTGSIASIALPARTRLISENDDKFTAAELRLVMMDFDNDRSYQAVTFGRGLYMAGACPLHYDGHIWSELGFHVGPEVIAVVKAGGGSMTPSTTYEYRAWYEWTDSQGEIHLGATSPGTLVTMGGGDTQVTLTLPTCRVTTKPGVRIMVARSLAALTGDTAEFFRVTSLDTTTAGTANGYVASSTTVDTVTFLDQMSDTTLRTFDEIYTIGGILSNDPTPLGAAIWRGKDRLFASDPSDGTVVRYSQPIADGYGVQWPPDLFLRVPPESGDVQAGTSRDNRVIVWTERGIYTFTGDGPAQDGTVTAGGGFSAVQVIPSAVGCTDPASIVRTPQGDMFKTALGIYLLGNDFSTSYIGAPVEGFNAQTVRRGIRLPDRTQVLFLTDTEGGKSLLYDHLFGQWSTFTNYTGADCAVAGGTFYFVRSDERAFRETVNVYTDAGSRIRLKLETAWIHMTDQLQGFNSFSLIHILGTWLSAHQLGISYQTDYTLGWTDIAWYDATASSSSSGWITGPGAVPVGLETIAGTNYGDGQYGDGRYGGAALGEYAFRLDLYETGQSIQLRFEDFEAAGIAGASFQLTELVVVGQILGNVRRPMTAGRSL